MKLCNRAFEAGCQQGELVRKSGIERVVICNEKNVERRERHCRQGFSTKPSLQRLSLEPLHHDDDIHPMVGQELLYVVLESAESRTRTRVACRVALAFVSGNKGLSCRVLSRSSGKPHCVKKLRVVEQDAEARERVEDGSILLWKLWRWSA